MTKNQIQTKKDMLKRMLSYGQISKENYSIEMHSLENYLQANVDVPTKTTESVQGFESFVKKVISDPEKIEQSEKAEEIKSTADAGRKSELARIDTEKASLSNSLHNVPTTQNAKEIVNKIIKLREARKQCFVEKTIEREEVVEKNAVMQAEALRQKIRRMKQKLETLPKGSESQKELFNQIKDAESKYQQLRS